MENRTQDANNSQLSTGNPNIQIVQPSRSEATPTVRHKPYEWIGGNIRRLPWNCHRMEAYSKTKEDSARKEGVNFLSGLWSLTRAKISLSSKHDFFSGNMNFNFGMIEIQRTFVVRECTLLLLLPLFTPEHTHSTKACLFSPGQDYNRDCSMAAKNEENSVNSYTDVSVNNF